MTHFVDAWSILETKNSVYDVADRLVEELATRGIKATCYTQGFRAEFDGVPVIERCTGEITRGDWYYHGKEFYEIKEYAVIEKYDGKVRLGDYRGPAGRRWSGEERNVLLGIFQGEDVNDGISQSYTSAVTSSTISSPILIRIPTARTI